MNQYILIKFGAREHMERLLHEGEVYMNTLAYYRDKERGGERHDPNEGIQRIKQMKGAVLKRKNQENGEYETIAKFTNGTARVKNSNYDRINAYCLFHLLISGDNKIQLSENVDERVLKGFGDAAVIIHDAVEFVTRVKSAAAKRALPNSRQAVEYVDMSTLDGEVDLFMKDLSFSYQKELRIAVIDQEAEAGPITLNIGSITDIACLMPAKDVTELSFEWCHSE